MGGFRGRGTDARGDGFEDDVGHAGAGVDRADDNVGLAEAAERAGCAPGGE